MIPFLFVIESEGTQDRDRHSDLFYIYFKCSFFYFFFLYDALFLSDGLRWMYQQHI